MIHGTTVHGITIPGTAGSTCHSDGDTDHIIIPGITATGDGATRTMEVTGAVTGMDTGTDTTGEEVTIIHHNIMPTGLLTTVPQDHIPMATATQGMHIVNRLQTGLPRRPQQLVTITGRVAQPLQQIVEI